jgi:hypothetical protein
MRAEPRTASFTMCGDSLGNEGRQLLLRGCWSPPLRYLKSVKSSSIVGSCGAVAFSLPIARTSSPGFRMAHSVPCFSSGAHRRDPRVERGGQCKTGEQNGQMAVSEWALNYWERRPGFIPRSRWFSTTGLHPCCAAAPACLISAVLVEHCLPGCCLVARTARCPHCRRRYIAGKAAAVRCSTISLIRKGLSSEWARKRLAAAVAVAAAASAAPASSANSCVGEMLVANGIRQAMSLSIYLFLLPTSCPARKALSVCNVGHELWSPLAPDAFFSWANTRNGGMPFSNAGNRRRCLQARISRKTVKSHTGALDSALALPLLAVSFSVEQHRPRDIGRHQRCRQKTQVVLFMAPKLPKLPASGLVEIVLRAFSTHVPFNSSATNW